MKKCSMIILAVVMFTAFAEKVTITSPTGNFSMEIEGISSSQGCFESNVVINNIMKRLNKLDRNYITKLKTRDRVEARQLIEEIKYLVNSIPDDVNIQVVGFHSNISASIFQILLSDIEDASFEDERITTVKIAAQNNYFDVAQVKQIMDIFDFSDGKLKALKILNPKIIDRDNSFQLINSFEFGDDKKKAERIMQSK